MQEDPIKRTKQAVITYSDKEKEDILQEAEPFVKELQKNDRGWDYSKKFIGAYNTFKKTKSDKDYDKLNEYLGLIEVSLYNTEIGMS